MGNFRIKPILTAGHSPAAAVKAAGPGPLPTLDELIEVEFFGTGKARKDRFAYVLTERADGKVLLQDGFRAGARTAMFMGLAGLPKRVRKTAMEEVRAILEKHGTADFLLNFPKQGDGAEAGAAAVGLSLLYKNGRSVSASSAGEAEEELKALFLSLARGKGLFGIFAKN